MAEKGDRTDRAVECEYECESDEGGGWKETLSIQNSTGKSIMGRNGIRNGEVREP